MSSRTRRTSRLVLATLIAAVAAFTGPAWGQHIHEDLKLLANDGAAGDLFGTSIAIDNGIIAVGALVGSSGISGAAYLIDATTGAQLFKLLPSDISVPDRFGVSIAIDNSPGNGIVAVGAQSDNINGTTSGSAYLFDASTGVLLAKLLPSDGTTGDLFGSSIAIDNGIVAIGAPGDDDNGSESGSVYLFDMAGTLLAKLLASDGAIADGFGKSISMHNGIVAVGATRSEVGHNDPGRAYLFDATTGIELFKLLPAGNPLAKEFGSSIAIFNGIVAVGAPFTEGASGEDNVGVAYLFDASNGQQIDILNASDGGHLFGLSMAMDNSGLVVGADSSWDTRNGTDAGSAYLFDASTGDQTAILVPSDFAAGDKFGMGFGVGSAIDIDNGVVAAGALGTMTTGVARGRRICLAQPSQSQSTQSSWRATAWSTISSAPPCLLTTGSSP